VSDAFGLAGSGHTGASTPVAVGYGGDSAMGLFKKRSTDPSETERLKQEIASMAARLDATDAAKQELGAQVAGLVARFEAPLEPPPAAPPPASVHPDEFRALVSRVSDLGQRLSAEADAISADGTDQAEATGTEVRSIAQRLDEIDTLSAQVQSIAERIDQLDARITSVSTELANQITELSGELDGLGSVEPVTEVVQQLREAQVKLAGEQARSQIAFRQDLANLADFLKPH
jgi:tetrahydromethanopterin S-methyltransferase subunit G